MGRDEALRAVARRPLAPLFFFGGGGGGGGGGWGGGGAGLYDPGEKTSRYQPTDLCYSA